jgi:hypothetical protein
VRRFELPLKPDFGMASNSGFRISLPWVNNGCDAIRIAESR